MGETDDLAGEASPPAGGPTEPSFIQGLLGERPWHWDGAEWSVVLAAIGVLLGFLALLVAVTPSLRRAALGLIRGATQPPATFGDYALPNRDVKGREGEVSRIAHAAKSGRRVVLHGTGGRGKSTLARRYVDRRRKRCRGICWIDASGEDGLREAMCWLAKTLDPALSGETDTSVLCARARDLVGAGGGRWLLVYDNAERQADLANWLPRRRRGLEVLISTRSADWTGDDFTRWPVGALDVETEAGAGVEVLWQAAGDNARRADGRAGAWRLARALDGLPLALVTAGAWLRDTPGTGFGEAQSRIAELIREEPEAVGDYPDSVYGAVRLSLDRLAPDASLLMTVFAWLAPEDLWAGLVTGLARHGPENEHLAPIPAALWTLARDGAAVERAFAELERRSLAEPGEVRDGAPSWRVHRLTQAVQRAVLAEAGDARARGHDGGGDGRHSREGGNPAVVGGDPRRRGGDGEGGGDGQGGLDAGGGDAAGQDWRAVAAAVVAAGYPFDSDFHENWPVCARLAPHVATLAADPPPVAAMDRLLNQASIYLSVQRRDGQALAYSESALRLTEARLGPAHEEVGIACNNLAGRLWRLGRVGEAEAMAARAVQISEVGGIPSEEYYARRLSTHGVMADAVGRGLTGAARAAKLALAARRHRQALAIGLRLHGRASREVGTDLGNLADLQAFQGRWGAALRLNGRALALRRRALAPRDPDLATSLGGLGITLLRSGRARRGYRGEAVLDLLAAALVIREQAFAPDHPHRIGAARWLAVAHRALAAAGPLVGGAVAPDAGRADALCAAYGFDAGEVAERAAFFAARIRLCEQGDDVPPMPGEGPGDEAGEGS